TASSRPQFSGSSTGTPRGRHGSRGVLFVFTQGSPAPMRFRFTRLDGWLLLMTFFWGSNFSVIKAALRELPGPAFNGIRLAIASLLFLAVIEWREGLARSARRVSRADWWRLIGLAIVGHFIYQILFLGGVARTSVANSALIFGCTPISVSLLGAWLGHERP